MICQGGEYQQDYRLKKPDNNQNMQNVGPEWPTFFLLFITIGSIVVGSLIFIGQLDDAIVILIMFSGAAWMLSSKNEEK
jgi:uncharacterized membrane protein YphA (DoxX/SURF4 family)